VYFHTFFYVGTRPVMWSVWRPDRKKGKTCFLNLRLGASQSVFESSGEEIVPLYSPGIQPRFLRSPNKIPTTLNPLWYLIRFGHKPTGCVMHQQFTIQQLYALPTLNLCVLYLSENKQRLVSLTL